MCFTAKVKDPIAQLRLAETCQEDNPRMAAVWLTQAASQSRNGAWANVMGRLCLWDCLHAPRAEAAFQLGQAYLSGGLGLDMDPDKALSWLQCAAAAGHVDALGTLRRTYGDAVAEHALQLGPSTWTAACAALAGTWHSHKGCLEAVYQLARRLEEGDHVVKDRIQALALLEWVSPYHQVACVDYAITLAAATAQDSPQVHPISAGSPATLWLERHLCVEDLKLGAAQRMIKDLAGGQACQHGTEGAAWGPLWRRALDLLLVAASGGELAAQHALGLCYQKGLVEDQDETKALTWYKKASLQGDAASQYAAGESLQRIASSQGLDLGMPR